jgi:sensor domain DACNV-containing protein
VPSPPGFKGPAYPAARAVAPRLETLFAEYVAEARRRGFRTVATAPDAAAIEAMIDAAFWASLRREEGYMPKISLAFVAPHEAILPLLFERPLALHSAALTRVAPAVERAGIHLGVWRDGNDFSVWGTARTIPATCFVLEVAAPGLLVVKHHRGDESGKFVNVAVLEADEIKIVDEHALTVAECPKELSSLAGFYSPASWVDSLNVLVQLAVSMRAHNRGGLLLVVPDASDQWRESIVRPMSYAVTPPFSELAALCRETPDGRRRREWQDAIARTVTSVAGLTAVDGAVIVTMGYEVLAFGAKIARRKGSPQVEQVTLTEPIEGAVPALVDPAQLGGTRHLSAAQFVHDQRDAVALVASQDGRFTVFAWSPSAAMVHAHRVEALLL